MNSNPYIQTIISNYFDYLPFKVAIMDKDHVIVAVNKKFKQTYGNNWERSKCHDFCKSSKIPCLRCQIQKVFQTGAIEIVQDSSLDNEGKMNFDVVIFSPIFDINGEVEFVQEISIPQKEVHHWENDFNVLFENSPNFITILDRDLNIVRANRRMVSTFGNMRGKKCYEIYKRKKQICNNCSALDAFRDGTTHSASQVGFTSTGEKTYYVMTAAPLSFDEDGNVTKVMEIGIDITEINKLQEQLNFIHDFYGDLIEKSSEAIIAIDKKGKLQIFNSAAEKLLGWQSRRKPGIAQARKFLPQQFFEDISQEETNIEFVKTTISDLNDQEIPVHLKIFDIREKNDTMGRVAIMSDLRPIIEVEQSKQRAKEIAFKEKFSLLSNDTISILKELKNFMADFSEKVSSQMDFGFQKKWNDFYDKSSEHIQLMNIFVKYSQCYFPKMSLIELNEFVESQFIRYRNLFAHSGLKMELSLSSKAPVINVDKESLHEIIYVVMLHYLSYIQTSCQKVTFRSFYDNNDIVFVIEVKCLNFDIPDFSEGLVYKIIEMIKLTNDFKVNIESLEHEQLLKISFIFK